MKKEPINQNLLRYAAKHNLTIIKTKEGIKFEDNRPPVDWSAVVAYTVIGIGLLFSIYALIFVW